MDPDPLVLANKLHAEAGKIIREIRLDEILEPMGGFVTTGSYFLDLMVYPDLDLYVPKVSIPRIFEATGQMVDSDKVIRVTFENEEHPIIPGGLYLNLRVNYGGWERPWKVDLWWLDADVIEEKMEVMHHFKQLLTPEIRAEIIRYKFSLINSVGRTPQFSGYFIYKAFLDEGLRDPGQICQFLIANGIKMS
jgi:hypothetical protein